MTSQPSILVVGAGPVGLTAAIELTRRGLQPRIIDRASGPAGESRALGVHARTLEILEPAGVTPQMLANGHRAQRAVFYDHHGQFMQVDFSLTQQKYNFALMIPQSETEQILLSKLNDLGVDVEWNTSLDRLDRTMQPIRATLDDGSTHQYEIVIGCDGSRSVVREALSIRFDGRTYPHDWQLADVRFHGGRPTNEIRIKPIDGHVLAYFPLAENVGRFVYSGARLREMIDGEVDVEAVIWESDFRISHRIVETYQKGNVFLAGDAAHLHSPVGGRGMNLGIEDAATLAWLIESGQTDRYTQMRQPIGKSVLKLTDTQTGLITSANPLIQFAIRRIGPFLLMPKAMQRIAFRRLSGADTPRPEWL